MQPTKVHVHLFYGADPRHYRAGENIGCLYGYHHAESPELTLTYSSDAKEGRFVKLARRALKEVLGFDFIHTWRNREAILDSDAVWTHTEHEHLSTALLLLLKGRARGTPMLLAQSVWLLDKWPHYSALRKWAYKKLLARADVLTTLASENAQLARDHFKRDVGQVYYGINPRDFPLREPKTWKPHSPVRIAAIGNDRDRDWESLVQAFRQDSRYDVRIATRRRVSKALAADNVKIAPAAGLAAARELYDWADVIVVPLRPNSHASGITVMLEAAAVGKPMVVTNVGALQDYFPAGEAAYIPPFNPQALREAVDQLAASPVDALRQAQAAAAGLLARDLTTQNYAMQHVRITQEMLRVRAASRARPAPARAETDVTAPRAAAGAAAGQAAQSPRHAHPSPPARSQATGAQGQRSSTRESRGGL